MLKSRAKSNFDLPKIKPINKVAVWRQVINFILMIVGVFIAAFGYVLFQIPHNIAAGGIGGIALIVNHYSGLSVGLIYWLLNVPMIILGYFYLGGWKFVGRTLIASTLFAAFTDILMLIMPEMLEQWPLTNDMLLTTIYGGIVGGIGGGIIFRSGSTMGGTSVLARIVQTKTGLPLSQIYLIDDGAIIFALGLVFGWENALYGLLMLFLNGLASDYTMEGASVTRTITIVTMKPQEVAQSLLGTLQRGVTTWEVTGAYTGQKRHMLMCTVSRTQVQAVKIAIAAADENAFVTIGVSHQALGAGFHSLKKEKDRQA